MLFAFWELWKEMGWLQFADLYRTASSTTGGWSLGTFLMCFYISFWALVSHFGPYGCHIIFTRSPILKLMYEVPGAFAISDIQSPPPPLDIKGGVYASCVRSSMSYGSETRPLLVDVRLKFERAEMQIIRWMCGISLKDWRTNEELRKLVGVEPIATFIRSGRLRWYRHVMRKGDEDWVKKCMEYRVEGKRPVGRPRNTWLECSSGYGQTWDRQRRCPW